MNDDIMKSVDENQIIKSLVGEIILDCTSKNCSVHLEPVENFENGSTGYFTNEGGQEIYVAIHNEDWWEVLVHEYCHFLQWTEGLYMSGPAWKSCNYIDPWEVQDRILESKNVPDELVESAYSIIIACEDNCIRKTLKMIEDYGLYKDQKDKIDYIKRGNLYLYLIYLEQELGKLKHEDKFWNSNKLFKLIPDKYDYDPENPEKFSVPKKVREFIIESESKT